MKKKQINIEKITNKALTDLNKTLKKVRLKPIQVKDLKSIRGFLNTLKNGFDIQKELYINLFYDHKPGGLFLFMAHEFDDYIKIKRESIIVDLIEFLYTEKTNLGKYKIIKRKEKKLKITAYEVKK